MIKSIAIAIAIGWAIASAGVIDFSPIESTGNLTNQNAVAQLDALD